MRRKRKRYKYVQTFVDRLGIERNYFRRGNIRAVLPGTPGSSQFDRAYKAAVDGIPIREEEKARIRKRIDVDARKSKAGVYLLLNQGYLAYIGSSKNMVQRVADHRTNGRPFDEAFYIATPVEDRARLEAILIRALGPPQNRAGLKRELQLSRAPDRGVKREASA